MAVHQDKRGAWFIQWREPETKRLKHRFFGKGPVGEAAAREAWAISGIRGYDRFSKPTGPRFDDIVMAYLADKQHTLADSTLAGMVPKIEAIILPALGDVPASQLDENRIRAYIDKRARKVKRTTIHRELSDIRAMLNWAVKKKLIAENPIAGMTMPKRDDEIIRPPSPDEVRRIMAASPPHLKRFILIGWYVGLRMGEELLSRRWQDVQWESKQLFVVSADKDGILERNVPINEGFYPKLLQWYIEDEAALLDPPRTSRGKRKAGYRAVSEERVRAALDELHIVRYKNRPVKKIKTAWKKAKLRAGITRRLRPYDLRHAFVTDLLASGENAATVGGIAGHKDKSTTLYVYNHVSEEQYRQAVNKRKSIM